jgi:hypothetical protein
MELSQLYQQRESLKEIFVMLRKEHGSKVCDQESHEEYEHIIYPIKTQIIATEASIRACLSNQLTTQAN